MPETVEERRTFDARPDRVDLRDRTYTPRLVSLPARYPTAAVITTTLPAYRGDGMILDQGQEGACTGFGLAAVINYLLWTRAREDETPVLEKVSPRMLFHLARFYDEWPGEDYAGSSCRGAMKGWHRHGVCREGLWPYRNARGEVEFITPDPTWEEDGALRPLGAYYRIEKTSIGDMQAAIVEVGAIYASAAVHEGWYLRGKPPITAEGIATIAVPADPKPIGGHAFALVGYTADGFIVQNSWGPGWGTHGFALLTYDDWIERGTDAWVAVMGAPTRSARIRERTPVGPPPGGPQQAFWSVGARDGDYTYAHAAYRPWDDKTAYRHSIVMGNNGTVLHRIPEARDALASHERVVYELPLASLRQSARAKVVLYAHGGLNDEDASIRRVQVLAPYFQANGVHPIFFAWKTGMGETLTGILEDHVEALTPAGAGRDVWGGIKAAAQDAKDGLIEAACQGLRVKAVWAQMKQNAEAAATTERPTLGFTVGALLRLRRALAQAGRGLEVHLVGHSAGAILLGHLLDLMANPAFVANAVSDPTLTGEPPLAVATCSLFAPACTVDFALRHYGAAARAGVLAAGATTIEVLTDERERADTVGPYGKSLLYLVSRGLEDYHRTPVLGMATAWDGAGGEWGSPRLAQQVADWNAEWTRAGGTPAVRRGVTRDASDGLDRLPWLHGTFDNDVGVISATIARITGQAPVARIENLRGY